ncbi:hypothetical protein, partial [Catellatospora chokoriensis]|uniref:hypothetical protein n=1 Tax=Catellatospora chokoriensis TaxID=310353 RepID=UPI00194050D0
MGPRHLGTSGQKKRTRRYGTQASTVITGHDQAVLGELPDSPQQTLADHDVGYNDTRRAGLRGGEES